MLETSIRTMGRSRSIPQSHRVVLLSRAHDPVFYDYGKAFSKSRMVGMVDAAHHGFFRTRRTTCSRWHNQWPPRGRNLPRVWNDVFLFNNSRSIALYHWCLISPASLQKRAIKKYEELFRQSVVLNHARCVILSGSRARRRVKDLVLAVPERFFTKSVLERSEGFRMTFCGLLTMLSYPSTLDFTRVHTQ